MGCASSTEVVTDPITGQQKTNKKLGGAYPGQRPPTHAPYTPPPSDFAKLGPGGQSTATTHFIQYGGGNALVLGTSPHATPHVGAAASKPLYVSVTLPEGVHPGDTIHVRSPDGRINAICVPDGMYPGSTFTVEFADAVPPKQQQQQPNKYQPSQPTIPAATTGVAPSGGDDGFVAGFNNHNYVPAVAVATKDTHMDVTAFHTTATSSTSYPIAPAYPAASAYPAPPKY